MLSFTAGASLDVSRVDGPLITLLECDSLELLGTGWHNVVQKADRVATDEIAADMARGRGGCYTVRAHSKTGDKFILAVSTLVTPATGIARGGVTLIDFDLARKHFPITRSVLSRKG